jgi:hypothetical protein
MITKRQFDMARDPDDYDDDYERKDFDDFWLETPDSVPVSYTPEEIEHRKVSPWLANLDFSDVLGLRQYAGFVGAMYPVPGYFNGGYDDQYTMRLCEIGEIVWYQAEEHEVVE